MRWFLQGHGVVAAASLAVALVAYPTAAVEGPEPRAVETETIVVPPEAAAPEPDIDADDSPASPGRNLLPAADLPVVEYDAAKLPTPVRRLREQIIAAAATGEPEALRPIFEAQDAPPQLGAGEGDDPVAFLVSLSGDADGREILAIIIEVFEAGYIHADAGTPDEIYLWPYFAGYPVEALTPPQLVELFKLVYAGDYEDMLTYGLYTSFRAGIAPDGTWRFFFAD